MSAVLQEQSQTIGSKIDQLRKLRTERLEHEKKAKGLKELEEVLVSEIIDSLDKEETTVGGSRSNRASIIEEEVATIEDYDEFYEYVHSNEAAYLLQRRAAQVAIKELLESGEDIPGVKMLTKRKLSLRKV